MAKVALVTGGAVRVGRAICLGLADAGFDVVVNYNGSEAAAHELASSIEGLGRKALVVRADVSSAAQVEEMIGEVREVMGRLDLIVNNASLFHDTPFLQIEEAEWDRVMAVNLKGPFLVVRAAAQMLTEAGGHVVNIVDLSALQAWAGYAHHSVSKAGLLHLTRVMAKALAPRVRANAVAPGAVLPPDDYSEEQLEDLRKGAALGRLGSPEDVVRTVLFLDRSAFITGEVIVVDGGRLL